MSQPKILAVVSQWPMPVDRGDALRTLQLLDVLRELGSVTILAVEREDTKPSDREALFARLPDTEIVGFSDGDVARGSSVRRLKRWIRAAWQGVPPWINGRYSENLAARVAEVSDEYDICIAISEAAGIYITSARWHWDKMNVLGSSTMQAVDVSAGFSRLRARILHNLSSRYERRLLRICGSVSVTSSEERERLQRTYRSESTEWPSYAELPAQRSRATKERTIGWLGSFGYPPNRDGLLRFLDEGWPTLRASDYRMLIIGGGIEAGLASKLESSYDGLQILGFVEDLGSVLSQCECAVAPVWEGAGVKMKTLTLMSYGVPVFGTSVAFEGINTTDLNVVYDSSEDLAAAIRRASEGELIALGLRMQGVVAANHSYGALQDAIRTSLLGAVVGNGGSK